ncbi:6998_t:CDS:2 [Cetraspora pellucida]|uniref:6998_t:CDS:1 n=1 Tax=Cetraspora pellucida TaxID=1433469 RepID=A0A9N9DUU9_9GLOM|nr:6998_t:CDS:2 [Cetraspora pellucida]
MTPNCIDIHDHNMWNPITLFSHGKNSTCYPIDHHSEIIWPNMSNTYLPIDGRMFVNRGMSNDSLMAPSTDRFLFYF